MHHSNIAAAESDCDGVVVVDTPCCAVTQKIAFVAVVVAGFVGLGEEAVEEKEANLRFQLGVGIALEFEFETLQKQKETLFLKKWMMKEVVA